MTLLVIMGVLVIAAVVAQSFVKVAITEWGMEEGSAKSWAAAIVAGIIVLGLVLAFSLF